MFLCSYVLMFLCSYVLMFLCSYVLMFLCRTESTDRLFPLFSLLFSLYPRLPTLSSIVSRLFLSLSYVVPLPPIRTYHISTEPRPCDMTWLINQFFFSSFFFLRLVLR
ncbi:uncharacterized protein F4817DRAFT_355200 [Daldinia loculata]|uniref:uncharacterized protein n=1 Tax=Daldinia loculata TaxID=103429 RepID=UPI0020C38726|nr:uncharacterized protein F4817DRAFT_355200 [Daldinia loculata]KAI1641641.1 hypothetical protein F4817DRAFT_355200 [Daldinia loculata]